MHELQMWTSGMSTSLHNSYTEEEEYSWPFSLFKKSE